MTKYQFGLCLLVVAGVQIYNGVKLANLARKRTTENAADTDKQMKRIDLISRRIQLVTFAIVLIVLWFGNQK